jgi:hypothetical protein
MKTAGDAARPFVWLILSAVSAACMNFYVVRIWSAGQPPHFSDLFAPWWGAHELLLHHRNPYSIAVAHEIQAAIYGAPATVVHPGDPAEIAGGFAYPLYVAFLLAATVPMSFVSVQRLFVGLSIVATAASLFFWIDLLRFRRSAIAFLIMFFLVFATFPVLEGLWLQNLSLVAAGLLFLAIFLLAKNRLILGGILLAISTFKPQFTAALIPWLMIWTVSNWRRRQGLAWSFAATMSALVGASEWLMPGWFGNFFRTAKAYTRYTFGNSLLDLWLPHYAARFAAAALVLVVFALCWRCRHDPANSPASLATIGLVLAATLLVIPSLAPHTQILLMPGFLCLLRLRPCLCLNTPNRSLQKLTISAAWCLLAWPWVAVAAMTVAAFVFSPSALFRYWELPLYTSPLLPLAVAVALGSLIYGQNWAADVDSLP